MLFKEVHLQGIKSGIISLAFRKWEKASVKKGALLKTSVGLIEVIDITTIDEGKITGRDVLNAGFDSKEQLLSSLRQDSNGSIYKITVGYYSEDPRIGLREQRELTNEKYSELKQKLQRLDRYSKRGNWTTKVLLAIKDNPHLPAIGIAQVGEFEKEWLKPNIRKLKNLGLTISLHIGYKLSPLGKKFTEKLMSENKTIPEHKH